MRTGQPRLRLTIDRTRVRHAALLTIVLILAVAGVRPSGAIARNASEDDPGYAVSDAGPDRSAAALGGAFAASNSAHGFRVRFDGSGARIEPLDEGLGTWSLGVALRAVGRGQAAEPVEPIAITTEGSGVAYSFSRRVSATFENAERGLAIGVSIPDSFDRFAGTAPVRIELVLAGPLRIEAAPDGASAEAIGNDRAFLRLDQVRATDAAGRTLHSRIEPGRWITLAVDDKDATYPISAEIVLTAAGPPAAAGRAPGLQRTNDPSSPPGSTLAIPNDTCAGATVIDLDIPVIGDTSAAVDDYRSPGNPSCYSGIGQPTTTAGFVGLGRDAVYRFTAPDTAAYSFRAAGYGGSDLLLYLTGTCPVVPPAQVVSCIAGANRTGFRDEEIFCRTLSAGEEVHIIVDDRTINSGGPFRLEVSRCRRESESNDAPGSATPVACGIEGSFTTSFPFADVDFFALGAWSADSRAFVLADANAANNFDVDMRVTSATDTLEYDDSDADTPFGLTSATSDGTPLPGGPAFIRVNSRSTTIFEPYRLFAAVQPPIAQASAESEPNDSLGQADSSVADYFAGALASAADVDLFAFQATVGEFLFLGLDGDPLRNATPINTALALLDSGGAVIMAVNDSNLVSSITPGTGSVAATTPASPGEGIAWRAAYTGTYYARVSGTAAGDWLLSITRDCIAATPTDLEVTKTAAAAVGTGSNLVYDIRVRNNGANDASTVELTDTIPTATTFQSITAPAEWTCTTPAAGGTGDVSCTAPVLPSGVEAVFTLVVRVDWCAGDGTSVLNTAEVTSLTVELDPADNSATASTLVADPDVCDDEDECTQSDVCQSGACVGTSPVTCSASNQCHAVGTCDPGTGVCSDPVLPNGTGCNDGDACTQTDTCQSGTCSGSNSVVCVAQDQCHVAGACHTGTGLCSNPEKPNGTACNDANACTQSDTCQAGACQGANAVVCTQLDSCHQVGVCAPATGVCSNPPEPDGTGCDDGSLCTQTDTCQAGACTGTNPVSCASVCTPGVDCAATYKVDYAPDTYLDEPHNVAANGAANDDTDFDDYFPGQLIDGERGANAWDTNLGSGASYEWVGWSNDDPTVTLQFPAARSFATITVGLNRTESVLIFEPDEIQIAFSLDGTTFGAAVVFRQSDATLATIPDGTRADVTLALPATRIGRYVRITFVNSGQWTFVDEIAFGAPDQCHTAGTCDPGTGLCSHPSRPDGTVCDDGDQCTQASTCQTGTCVGSDPLGCAALDDCHEVGACNPLTGVCTNPVRSDGSSCSDGNACTQTDACQTGVCEGTNPVICTALDQCHVAGVCNTATAVCSNPAKDDGEACNDGSLCTQIDTCRGGACQGASPVVCTALDPCHLAGTCDPGTGVCPDPPKPDGSSCVDGDACTRTDTCQAGACQGADPVVCVAQDACHQAGVCDTGTGLCPNPTQPDGTGCDDGSLCTQTDTCQAGTCTGANPVSCDTVCTPGVDCPSAYKFSHAPSTGSGDYFDEPHNLATRGAANDNTGFAEYGAGQLTDGVRGSDDWSANGSYEWVGWSFDDPVLTFEFPSARTISSVSIGLNRNEAVLIFAPDEVQLEFSLDGTTFGGSVVFRQSDATLPTFADLTREDVALSFSTRIARYVRITFANDEKWTFADEVAFGAPDQCHSGGTCDPGTGICSNPAQSDGTICDDGDLCTLADSCQTGTCAATPVVCTAQNDCHEVGTCDSGTGVCSNPAKIDGEACSDADLCTQTDTCSSGVCQGANPVVCPAPAACHLPGTCVSGTGVCTDPLDADGATCADGAYCTVGEICTAGACGGGAPRVCTDPAPCSVGTCDEDNDECDFAPVNAGDPDGDGVPACIDSCPDRINGGSDAGCVAAPAGLVAWWPLDETDGVGSEDITADHDGIRIDGPTPIAGNVAGGLTFDGVDDYVEVADDSGLDFGTGDFSVDAWIRTTSLSVEPELLLDKRREQSVGGAQGWALFLFDGRLWFQLSSGAAAHNFDSGVSVNDDQWHHVAVTVDRDDPAGGTFYIDYTTPLPTPVTFDPTAAAGTLDNDLSLRFGRRSDSTDPGFYLGELDEVELFAGVALTAAEVEAIATAGAAGKCKPGQDDLDGDGEGDACDADDDGDGTADSTDCAPFDDTAYAVPGEVALIRVSPVAPGSNEVEWSVGTGGTAHVYDVVTGLLSELPVGPGGGSSESGSCAVSGTTATLALDPAVGTGVWILVRAQNQCGAGSWGTERDNVSPPFPLLTARATATCP